MRDALLLELEEAPLLGLEEELDEAQRPKQEEELLLEPEEEFDAWS